MKKIIFITILTTLFTINSFAQDKTSDLKKLLEIMDVEKTIDATMDNIIPMIKQQAGQKVQQENFDKFIEFLMNETKALSKKLVNTEMVNIYDKYFTHDEIKDLIKFYSSPTGQKFIEKTPEISKDMMNSMMNKYMPEFQKKIMEKIEEFKQKTTQTTSN